MNISEDEYRDISFNLSRQKRYGELCDFISDVLLSYEGDPEFRERLKSDLISALRYDGRDDDSLALLNSLISNNPDDPRLSQKLGGWYYYAPHPGWPTDDHMVRAARAYETAFDAAKRANAWVRFVGFDLCRLLTDKSDYPRLSEVMVELLDDFETPRPLDITCIENDWLGRVPPGALNDHLRHAFIQYRAADQRRRRASKDQGGAERVPSLGRLKDFLE